MTVLEKLIQTTVPESDQPVVDLFRDHLGDHPEINTLEEVQESTDLELYRALLLTMNEFNNVLVFEPNFQEFVQIPDLVTFFLGATLKILTKKGIVSARNTLTYQDAGGITVQDYDKYGRYVNYFNIMISAYYNSIRSWNAKSNTDACYGYAPSEYSQSSRYQW
jgi:hypothetical protein